MSNVRHEQILVFLDAAGDSFPCRTCFCLDTFDEQADDTALDERQPVQELEGAGRFAVTSLTRSSMQ